MCCCMIDLLCVLQLLNWATNFIIVAACLLFTVPSSIFFNWANFIAFLYYFMTRTMCSSIFFTWAKTCISVLLHGLCTVRNHVLFFVEIWFGFRCLLAYSAAAWLKFVYWKQCDAYKLIFICCSSWSDKFTVHIDVVSAW